MENINLEAHPLKQYKAGHLRIYLMHSCNFSFYIFVCNTIWNISWEREYQYDFGFFFIASRENIELIVRMQDGKAQQCSLPRALHSAKISRVTWKLRVMYVSYDSDTVSLLMGIWGLGIKDGKIFNKTSEKYCFITNILHYWAIQPKHGSRSALPGLKAGQSLTLDYIKYLEIWV